MKNMRVARQAQKITMRQLGDMIGASESTISLYERGLHQPSTDTMLKIAEVLHVSLDYLVGRTNTIDPNENEDCMNVIESTDTIDANDEIDRINVIGRNIKRIRKELHISQIQLANRAGLSQSSISEMEKGENNPSAESLRLIAHALGCTLNDLVDEGEKYVTTSEDGRLLDLIYTFSSLSESQKSHVMSYIHFLKYQSE